ncbi:MAG TPA: Do family serine endopeptidase [Gammaproteobacteria bacterium]|nr:Do family serine endopeptidase [Gammaproteobacteria bacterium]
MKRFLTILLGLFFSACAFASSLPTTGNSIAPMLKKITPSVVNIAAQGEMAVPNMPAGATREFASLGSGVIVDASKGYVITNNHVIEKAKTITVTLSDGRNFKAKLIGTDPNTDIAVLQIPAEKLTAMPMGNSDSLQVGDFVAAIGNPFGLNQTVTSGIVSALQRGSLGIEGPQGLEDFIQTDASINPGNSGGALVDLKGELVGINTAILTPEGGNIGIGFAIPINMAKTIMTQLVEYGSVKRGLMGVIVQDLTPDLATGFDETGIKGAVITQLSPNSPAQKAGLLPGDIIETVNGEPMETASAVRNSVGLLRVGAKIDMEVLRKGKKIAVNVVTADPDVYMKTAQTENPFLFGLAFRDFDAQTPAQGHVIGVQITFISKSSAAWRAGLLPGDVIMSAAQTPVKSIHELQEIASKDSSKSLLLNVARGNGALFVVLDKD